MAMFFACWCSSHFELFCHGSVPYACLLGDVLPRIKMNLTHCWILLLSIVHLSPMKVNSLHETWHGLLLLSTLIGPIGKNPKHSMSEVSTTWGSAVQRCIVLASTEIEVPRSPDRGLAFPMSHISMQQTLSFCKENCMIFNRGIVDGESDTSFTLEVCVRVLPRCFWKLSERLKTVSLQADFFAICLRSFETFSTTWWWICVGALRALIHWCWKNTWEFRMAKWCCMICMGWEEFRMDKMLRNKDHKEQRLSIRSQRIDSGNWEIGDTSANQDIQICVLVFSSSLSQKTFKQSSGCRRDAAMRRCAVSGASPPSPPCWACVACVATGSWNKTPVVGQSLGPWGPWGPWLWPIRHYQAYHIGSTIDGCFFGKSTQTWKI